MAQKALIQVISPGYAVDWVLKEKILPVIFPVIFHTYEAMKFDFLSHCFHLKLGLVTAFPNFSLRLKFGIRRISSLF